MTVHNPQGGEFDALWLVLPERDNRAPSRGMPTTLSLLSVRWLPTPDCDLVLELLDEIDHPCIAHQTVLA